MIGLAGRREENQGFTLIELMVVLLLIGILTSIALPTFVGARKRADDRAAQSALRNAFSAAKFCRVDSDTYTGCDATKLRQIEPMLTWVNAGTVSTSPSVISATVPAAANGTTWEAATHSGTGTCWYIKDVFTGGTKYGSGAACDATNAAGAAATSW